MNIKDSYNRYKRLTPGQKRFYKLKVAIATYWVITSLYGQYKLPQEAFYYVRDNVVSIATKVALANGMDVKVVEKNVPVPVLDPKLSEQISKEVANKAAESAKEGVDESIRKNLGK